MEKYGKILLFIIPIFILLILIEKFYGWYFKKEKINNLDTISSLTSGLTMITKNVLGLSITIITYTWIEERIALTHINSTVLTYVIAFIVLDFSHYWIHRIEHANNFFWNSHIVHHSSEEFDLACALRQPISSFVKLFSFFMVPAALLGISPVVIATVTPIQFYAQFWYHTRYINRMGILEHVIVTPSHHRVHHAINKEYLDKNLSQIFIIWDKLFGTFQEERKDIPPVYGITRPVRTWNPIKINFQHMWLLIKDAWRANNIKDKLQVWTNHTGWRPKDVEAAYPVYKIEDVYNFEKYFNKKNTLFMSWVWFQLSIIILLTVYMLANISSIGSPSIFIYGGFIFLFIYALTDLMDGNTTSLFWELFKSSYGALIIFSTGDWFGMSRFNANAYSFALLYFMVSVLVTFYISMGNKKPKEALQRS